MMMPREKTRCYLENALEFLDQPGEWYADRRTGVLYYWPLPDEDMISAKVFAPVLTSIVELKGTPGFSVKNIHFKGLHFAHVNWPLPKGGYYGLQACFYSIANFQRPWFDLVAQVSSAINWQFAKSCSFEDGQISQVGGVGLQVGRGCSSNLIQGNIFCDIGGNGLMIGEGKDSAHFAEAVTVNRVLDNHVYRCGTEYFGAVGIWAGYASETIIAHNAVHDLPYSAISVGWRWDTSPTGCRSNIIEYNDVHHFMGTLSDGAGIYTLGFQPGTIIRGNLVHENAYHGQGVYGANSLQLDDGSKGLYIESNITCDGAGRVHLNLVPGLATTPAEWNTWGTNYFEVNSSDTNFPKELAGKAGLEPEYRKRLAETR